MFVVPDYLNNGWMGFDNTFYLITMDLDKHIGYFNLLRTNRWVLDPQKHISLYTRLYEHNIAADAHFGYHCA